MIDLYYTAFLTLSSAKFRTRKKRKKEPESSVLQGFPALRVSYLFLSRISIASPKLKKRYFSRTASS